MTQFASKLAPIALLLATTTALLVAGAGCDTSAQPDSAETLSSSGVLDVAPTANHAHPSEGPHHGDLVELGNEEYHAEITHSDKGEVTVYVLDSGATKSVPIDATEVTINLTHDGKAEQFKLSPTPDTEDPTGKSSRFTLVSPDLVADLDHEGTVAKLVINIAGKQYTGKIEHQHDHDHGHAH